MGGRSICDKLARGRAAHLQWEALDGVLRETLRMNFDRYRRPIAMSDPGRHAALFDGLPRDTGALAETVQGLLIHQHIAPAYGVTLMPWDVWGALRRRDSELDLAFFDRLAIVSREPDAHVDELSALYCDERVSVPGTVFNAELGCLQEL